MLCSIVPVKEWPARPVTLKAPQRRFLGLCKVWMLLLAAVVLPWTLRIHGLNIHGRNTSMALTQKSAASCNSVLVHLYGVLAY
jgi:hypothetical protein